MIHGDAHQKKNLPLVNLNVCSIHLDHIVPPQLINMFKCAAMQYAAP